MTFLNYAGQEECIDVSIGKNHHMLKEGLDGNGWAVQACNEMVMPFASRESTSMFPSSEFNKKEINARGKAMYS
jgi:hypothetical protein